MYWRWGSGLYKYCPLPISLLVGVFYKVQIYRCTPGVKKTGSHCESKEGKIRGSPLNFSWKGFVPLELIWEYVVSVDFEICFGKIFALHLGFLNFLLELGGPKCIPSLDMPSTKKIFSAYDWWYYCELRPLHHCELRTPMLIHCVLSVWLSSTTPKPIVSHLGTAEQKTQRRPEVNRVMSSRSPRWKCLQKDKKRISKLELWLWRRA